MADKTPAPEATAAASVDSLSRADHEGILRDTRNTHDTAIRAMQVTVDAAKAAETKAEERAAAAEKKVKELDEDRLVRKLDSFIGKKIAPAEREVMLETIRTSEALFDKQVALRPDIVGERMVPADDATQPRASSVGDKAAGALAFQRAVKTYTDQGMSRNDALAAATRSLAHQEVALCPFLHCTTRRGGGSRAPISSPLAPRLPRGNCSLRAPTTTP